MTTDEIIRMAREAGFETDKYGVWTTTNYWTEELERFAALVAAHEREKQAEQKPVQVSAKKFVELVSGKEDLVGMPVCFAQWPNKE